MSLNELQELSLEAECSRSFLLHNDDKPGFGGLMKSSVEKGMWVDNRFHADDTSLFWPM